jgi:hypothetical protein
VMARVVCTVTSWGAIGRDPALHAAGARLRGLARNLPLVAGAGPAPLPSPGRRASRSRPLYGAAGRGGG